MPQSEAIRRSISLSFALAGCCAWPAFGQALDHGFESLLSPAVYADIRFQMVQIPMPDGVKLSAAIWRPNVDNEKFPVILVATPYNKLREVQIEDANFFVSRGYVFVSYDLRGRYDSEGQAYLYGEKDGEDLNIMQSWAARQPWSTGKIGMYGGSYLGFIQWEGALFRNPNLTALIPQVSPDDHYDNVYPSGAFQLSNSLDFLWFCCGGRTNEPIEVMSWQKWYEHLPLRDDAAWAGIPNTTLWRDLLSHPNRDDYWPGPGERIAPGQNGPGKYAQINAPTFNISGWYDQVSQATINNFIGMVKYGPANIRKTHKLLMGPWSHGTLFQTKVGELNFPNQAAPNGNAWRLRWFDFWLKNVKNDFDREAPVYIYVMGSDVWRNECEWPLQRTQYRKLFLHSGGRSNSSLGDGSLEEQAPIKREPSDHFSYDPAHPVPTLGGNVAMHPPHAGPYDQTAIELRSDVLVYTTPVLAEDIEVTGPVVLHLLASTDRTDTDFTGKLVDVYQNGYSKILLEGIIRGRHAESFRTEKLLKPNQIYDLYVDLWSTSNTFLKGHRIRLEVSSSNFPKYDRNPNTGDKFGEKAEFQIAHQTVYHEPSHDSYLLLPVIPAGTKPCQTTSARAASMPSRTH